MSTLSSLTLHTCKGIGLNGHTCPHMFSVKVKEKKLAIKDMWLLRTEWDLGHSLENVLTVLTKFASPSGPDIAFMCSTQKPHKYSPLHLWEPRGKNVRICLSSLICHSPQGGHQPAKPSCLCWHSKHHGHISLPMASCADPDECYHIVCAHMYTACSHQMLILGKWGIQQCCFVWLLWY